MIPCRCLYEYFCQAPLVFVLGFWNHLLQTWFGLPIYNILMGTAIGGLGAWLSVIQRSRTTELDVAAGPMLHYLGFFARSDEKVYSSNISVEAA